MILIIWAESGPSVRTTTLPTFAKMHIVWLSDDASEYTRICVEGSVTENATAKEILNDWKNVFEAIDDLTYGKEDRVFVFPNSRSKTRFIYVNGVMMKYHNYQGCSAIHLFSLGSRLIEDGVALDVEDGIPKAIDIIKEYGVDFLFHESEMLGDITRNAVKKKPKLPSTQSPMQPDKTSEENKAKSNAKRTPSTKAYIMEKQIAAFCEEYGMHAEFKAGTAFITTIAGEWFFMYNDRPIRLHHKNYSTEELKSNRQADLYHLQGTRYSSPLQVLRYISNHDLDLKRRVMQDIDGMIAEDHYFYSDREEITWYYKALKNAVGEMPDSEARKEFSAVVDKVFFQMPDNTQENRTDGNADRNNPGIFESIKHFFSMRKNSRQTEETYNG